MKDKKYFLSIDNGLTMAKAAIVGINGNIIGVESFKNQIINEKGFSEIEMGLLAKKTLEIIKKVITNTKINPEEIICIGNSGHGGGLYLVGEDGEPVRNAITSVDSRADYLIVKWKKEDIDGYSATYSNMWNGQAIPLLYWLKENEPDTYNKINKILFCKDWIKFQLTGEFYTDYTDASNAGLINLNTRNYDSFLYEKFGLGDLFSKLPSLNKSSKIIGTVTKDAAAKTGLVEGTPVINGSIDLVACALGSGLHDETAYSLISGTWNINSAIINEIIKNKNIMALVLIDNDKFLAKDTSPTSAVNLEWFLSEVLEKIAKLDLNRKQIYIKIDEEIKNLNISMSNALFFPFIYKSKLSSKMKGTFYGFDASQNVYNLIYAIYEGVIFAHFMHISNLKNGGIHRNKAILSGGATNSELWCQMFSDILNIDIAVTSTNEVGILGLAIYQALGAEIFKTVDEAISNMVSYKKLFKPNTEKNHFYMERFAEFTNILNLFNV